MGSQFAGYRRWHRRSAGAMQGLSAPLPLPEVSFDAFPLLIRQDRWVLSAKNHEQIYRTHLKHFLSYTLGQFLAQRHPRRTVYPTDAPLRMRLAWRHTWRDWTFSPELLLYAPQHRAYTLYDTEVPTPGYVLLNLTMHWRWLAFGVQNALGTRYQPHLSPYRQWVPGGIDFPVWNAFVRLSL